MLRKKALLAIMAAGLVATSFPVTPVSVQAATTSISTEYNEETATFIEFSDTAAVASGTNADTLSIKNNTAVTIDKAGTYVFSGSCTNGSIAVKKNTTDVIIVFAGLDLTATETAPLSCKSGTSTQVIVKADSKNTLTDTDADADEDDGQAGIKVKKDSTFTLSGAGTLTVNGQKKNAIKAGANVVFTVKDVNLNISSAKHGISAEHKIIVESGNLNIVAENDGIKSAPDTDTTTGTTTDTNTSTTTDASTDTSTDTSEGSIILAPDSCTIQAKGDGIQAAHDIQITRGTYHITTSEDGIQANNDITIDDGSFTIQTNGGSTTTLTSSSASCKAIKAVNNITINGGTFDINSADDAIHSNTYVTVLNGTLKILTGDDGIHANTTLTVGAENTTGPKIDVQKSYEGLEAGTIYLDSGDISVVASDDGVNAAGGTTNGNNDSFHPGGQRPGASGSSTGSYAIHVNGGKININSGSDGFDSNGNIYFTGGVTNVQSAAANGPGSDGFPLDHDGSLAITGGTIFAAGSNQMVELPDSTASTQTYTAKTLSSALSAGTEISIRNAAGDSLTTETLLKNSNFVFYSSPEMSASDTYSLVNAATGETITASDSTGMGGGGGFPGGGGGFPGGGGFMPSRPSMGERPSWGGGFFPSIPGSEAPSSGSAPSDPFEQPSDGSTPSAPAEKPSDITSLPTEAPSDVETPSSPEKPSDASRPAVPSGSDKPSDGSRPTQPSGSDKPSDEINPSQPSASEKPSDETNPSQPSGSERPSGNTRPSRPSRPTENPSEGSTPSQPSGSEKPSDAEVPSLPGDISIPSFPGDISIPSLPSDVSIPSLPGDVSIPSLPGDVSIPSLPSDVSIPSLPSDVSMPSLPSDVSMPSLPIEKPSEEPSKAENPSKPEKPSDSQNEEPEQPGIGDLPTQPSEEPSKADTPSLPVSEPSNVPSEKPSLVEEPSQPSETTPSTPSETTPSTPSTGDTTKPSTSTAQNAKKAGLSVTLSASSYKYNGNVRKPSVTVKTKDGKKVSTKNYTVSYSSGCKKVGTYTVKVTFKGNYTGTLTKTFTIAPTGTSIKKLVSSTKAFTIGWKKQATQTSGYQIQYSTSKNFASAKTVTVNSTSKTTKKISSLSSKKKYYVRIRTYKTVNGKKIASNWSAAKTIKTK